MASVTYGWNPYQERIDCNIKKEVIKPASQSDRREFVPRAAPFFSRNAVLRIVGSTTPLVMGVDYAFAHTFDRFITKYTRNSFGSVVLLKDFGAQAIEIDYSTLGGSLVLDQVAFAELVANIVNSPRTADWSDLVDVPTAWDPDPHPHPVAQTYDYLEMVTQIKSLLAVLTDTTQGVTLKDMLQQHMDAELTKAHKATAADIGLDQVANIPPSTFADLQGNSATVVVTMETMKEAFRRLANGTLVL